MASAVIEGGSDNVGPVVSCTVTVNCAELELPAASVAVHVTGVEPMGYVVGVHGAGSEPSTLSTAVPLNEDVAPPDDVASSVWSAGAVTTGAVVSGGGGGAGTWMVAVPSPPIVPSASLAETVTT